MVTTQEAGSQATLRPTPPPRGVRLALVLVVLLPVAAALAISAYTGSLSIPHNDDWAYAKSARLLVDTGELRMQGWVAAALVGQLYLFTPVLKLFGSTFLTLNVGMAVLSVLALTIAYDLYRRCLAPKRAVFATLVTALFPGFLLLSTSFMTDIPALAAVLLSLSAGVRALERRSVPWLVTAMLAGGVGVSIRQQCIAAPIAVLATYALLPPLPGGRRPLRAALVVGLGLLAGVGAFLSWRQGLSDVDTPTPGSVEVLLLARTVGNIWATLGLALLPVTGLLLPRLWSERRRVSTYGALVCVVLALTALHLDAGNVFKGNYLEQTGPYTAAGYGADRLFPKSAWHLIEGLAVLSAAVLTALAVAALRDRLRAGRKDWLSLPRRLAPFTQLLVMFAVIYGGGLLALGSTGWSVFDRYLLPLLVPLLALGLRARIVFPRFGASLAAAGTAGVTVLTLVLTWASGADDHARWEASEVLVKAGASPRDVSSGLEWQGTAARGPADITKISMAPRVPYPAYFTPLFAGSRDCFIISRSPQPARELELVGMTHYDRLPGMVQGTLWIYRRSPAC